MALRFLRRSPSVRQGQNLDYPYLSAERKCEDIAYRNFVAAPHDPRPVAAEMALFDKALSQAARPAKAQTMQQEIDPHQPSKSAKPAKAFSGRAGSFPRGLLFALCCVLPIELAC